MLQELPSRKCLPTYKQLGCQNAIPTTLLSKAGYGRAPGFIVPYMVALFVLYIITPKNVTFYFSDQ
jgi:hypothetical protein